MNSIWLHQQPNASKVIVFFNGWGFDSSIVQHLICDDDTDVLVVSNYSDLSMDLVDLSAYTTRSLIAWSFGVASYCHWQTGRDDPFQKKVAINGTMMPIDRRQGIATKVVQKTIDTLSQESFQVFAARCFNRPQTEIKIDVEQRRVELTAIKNRGNADQLLAWDKVWLSTHDKIFLPKNTQLAWHGHTQKMEFINAPHAPFNYWRNWQAVLA